MLHRLLDALDLLRASWTLTPLGKKIYQDPRRSICHMARKSGISHATAVGVLQKDLGLKSRARQCRNKLTLADKVQGLQNAVAQLSSP